MGHNDCTGFQEVELPARLITKIQLAWLIGSRIGWGDEGMDSMTSEYLYPILLNRVSDQGYTNTLSDKKKDIGQHFLWSLSLQLDPWFYILRTLLLLHSFLCLDSLL